jgi:hypothetical protein
MIIFGTNKSQEVTGGWRYCKMRNVIILLVTKYQDGQIKDGEMGMGGGGMWRKERNAPRGLIGKPEGQRRFEDRDGRLVLKWILQKYVG